MDEMQALSNTLFSNNTLGLVVASIIFVITLILVIRKIIGFVLTLIFLFFAIVSGLAIANNDIVRDYLRKNTHSENSSNQDWETKFNNFKQQLSQKIDEITGENSQKKDKPSPDSSNQK
jgi:ABC-type bacteriocin/lantibiotic exporter with double-glycine peptidase domain